MKLNTNETHRLAAFPDVLRELIFQELAAGNEISEFSECYPAPPVGDCIKLVRKVGTRPRESSDGIDFYDRDHSCYSGEFTDTKRFYFILEPPNPPHEEVNMDALLAGRIVKTETMPERPAEPVAPDPAELLEMGVDKISATPPRSSVSNASQASAVERFRESMVGNYERWHDGTGYDLSIFKTSTPQELMEIEKLLIAGGVNDWRDVEALAGLDTAPARELLKQTLKTGGPELAQAVSRYAPELVIGNERTATLVAALEKTDFYGGLTQALLEVESFHPPEVIAALLRGVLERNGDHACHFAAMLMFLHGQADSSFDWDQRPFFLQFNTDDRTEREAMFRELCDRIGISTSPYLSPL